MDNFSWGNIHGVIGEWGGTLPQVYDPFKEVQWYITYLVMLFMSHWCMWTEYECEAWEHGSHHSDKSGVTKPQSHAHSQRRFTPSWRINVWRASTHVPIHSAPASFHGFWGWLWLQPWWDGAATTSDSWLPTHWKCIWNNACRPTCKQATHPHRASLLTKAHCLSPEAPSLIYSMSSPASSVSPAHQHPTMMMLTPPQWLHYLNTMRQQWQPHQPHHTLAMTMMTTMQSPPFLTMVITCLLWSSICTFIIYPEYISIYPKMITNDLCQMPV